MEQFVIPLPGTLGNNVGASNGTLLGSIANTALTACYLNRSWDSAGQHCVTEKNATLTFVDESTPFGEGTADDVEVLTGTPAVGDAVYFGSENAKFGKITLALTTAGVGTWTVAWEYWNGSAWTALSGVTDGTTAFTATADTYDVTFTVPSDWAKNTVPTSINAYWVRARVATYSALTTLPQVGQGWIITDTAVFVNETTDINSSSTADVPLLSSLPTVGDAVYFGYTAKWTKLRITLSTAMSATLTGLLEYYNGASWTTIPLSRDDSTAFSAGTSTYLIHFEPPSDWATVSVNGSAALYWIRFRVSAFTSMTTPPVATQAWVLPIAGSAVTGFKMPSTMADTTFARANFQALTASGSTADSIFMLLNKTKGSFVRLTWTKATPTQVSTIVFPASASDEIALVQLAEDGTTEFANGSIILTA